MIYVASAQTWWRIGLFLLVAKVLISGCDRPRRPLLADADFNVSTRVAPRSPTWLSAPGSGERGGGGLRGVLGEIGADQRSTEGFE